MRRTATVGVFLILAAFATRCGARNPASPSESAGAGAALTGTIVSAGTSTPVNGSMSGLVVSVPGTNLSASVSGSRFQLSNIPQGDVTVRFSGAGVSGDVALSAVQRGETIDIGVSVAPASVTLESERRSSGNEDQLEGRVESLPPTTPANTLVVAGVTVKTDGTTQFFNGGTAASFAALAIGMRVHVKGHRDGTGLTATVVQIQNTNTDIPVEINGVIQTFSGTVALFQLTIDGRLIKGDATTEFFGNSAFADLGVGKRAEVKGSQRDGFVFANRIHVNVDDGDPGQDESASIEGPLTSKIGAPPVMTLIVGGTTVHTSASTEVRRKGDVQTLSVLEIGMTLHVVGDRKSDSSIDARMIQIKDDAVGAQFEIQGSMGGLKGACPAVTFGVNGYSIVADGSTTFTPACSSFKSGDKVTVKGVVQSGGTVKATSVTK